VEDSIALGPVVSSFSLEGFFTQKLQCLACRLLNLFSATSCELIFFFLVVEVVVVYLICIKKIEKFCCVFVIAIHSNKECIYLRVLSIFNSHIYMLKWTYC